jgi:hypothetical protein
MSSVHPKYAQRDNVDITISFSPQLRENASIACHSPKKSHKTTIRVGVIKCVVAMRMGRIRHLKSNRTSPNHVFGIVLPEIEH